MIRSVVAVVTVVTVVAVLADLVIVTAAMVIGAMMLLTNVGDGIVAPLASLSDRGNGDRTDGRDRDQGLGVSRMHWGPPFPGRW